MEIKNVSDIYILITKQILNNNVFSFTGGSIGALNGLYKYRRELALREAEGIYKSPVPLIIW